MNLLPSPDLDNATELNATATAFVKAQGNAGSRWSDVWTDGNGNYGVVWDASIAPAFKVTQDDQGNLLVKGVALVEIQPIPADQAATQLASRTKGLQSASLDGGPTPDSPAITPTHQDADGTGWGVYVPT